MDNLQEESKMKIANKPIYYLLHHFFVITVMILPMDNSIKLLAVLGSFYLVFGKLTREEAYLFVGVSLFFTFMNYMSILNGIFTFTTPDFLGQPWYEFCMWGIYVMHLKRMAETFFKKEMERYQVGIIDFICVGLVVLVFSLCKDKLAVTLFPLFVNLFFLYQKKSKLLLSSYIYFIIIGGILELVGTNGGQWSYPSPDFFGVPFWYVNVFGSFAIYFPLVYKGLVLALNTPIMRGVHSYILKKVPRPLIHKSSDT